ncbi:MAG: hypothetical protein HC903_21910 [Methylacidiphilales bacterium]|nr:hypothetical protein [Candidatus Methylacidiphilales bacterium]
MTSYNPRGALVRSNIAWMVVLSMTLKLAGINSPIPGRTNLTVVFASNCAPVIVVVT